LQISTVTITITRSLFPSLFSSSALPALAPSRVWNLNQSLFSAHTVANLGEGVLTFLQMDEFTGCMASLIWAATMHWKAKSAMAKAEGKEGVTWKYWAWMQAKIFGTIPWGGPFAPALVLLWERDEMVLGWEGNAEEEKDI